ncbi:MAG: response regulator [Candidatus Omnitrophica bacterium]|nr:response regulator [Candidatus Omnitrophota bacterium]
MSVGKSVDILLVEDNPNDAELIARALEKHKFIKKVHVVESGEEALDFLFARGKFEKRKREPAVKLVFLDLNLPGMSGIDVLKEMRADDSTRNMPVVVLTVSKEEGDMLDSYSLDVSRYIVKPASFDRFAEELSELALYWLLFDQLPD